MNRIITPDDVVITIDVPNVRVNEDEHASQELKEFIQSEWGTGEFESYIEEILSLFQSAKGSYGITEIVTFIISCQFRESLIGAHQSLSMEELFPFVGLENDEGVLELGELTENMWEDISVQSSF